MAYTANYSIQQTALPISAPVSSTRVVMTITSVVGFLDKALFVYQTNSGVSTFQHVATPQQLRTLGTAPDPVTGFYRSAVMDVVITPATDAAGTISDITAALQALCTGSTLLDTFGGVTTGSVTG